jgi:hypothetical protein
MTESVVVLGFQEQPLTDSASVEGSAPGTLRNALFFCWKAAYSPEAVGRNSRTFSAVLSLATLPTKRQFGEVPRSLDMAAATSAIDASRWLGSGYVI